MGAVDRSRAQERRPDQRALDPEPLEREGGAADVDERVHRTHLVEVHLVRRAVVDESLGDGDPPEHADGHGPRALPERRALDHRRELGETLWGGEDVSGVRTSRWRPDRERRQTRSAPRARLARYDGLREALEVVDPESGIFEVEQGGQEHVAGHASEGLDEERVGLGHRCARVPGRSPARATASTPTSPSRPPAAARGRRPPPWSPWSGRRPRSRPRLPAPATSAGGRRRHRARWPHGTGRRGPPGRCVPDPAQGGGAATEAERLELGREQGRLIVAALEASRGMERDRDEHAIGAPVVGLPACGREDPGQRDSEVSPGAVLEAQQPVRRAGDAVVDGADRARR